MVRLLLLLPTPLLLPGLLPHCSPSVLAVSLPLPLLSLLLQRCCLRGCCMVAAAAMLLLLLPSIPVPPLRLEGDCFQLLLAPR